MNATSQVTLTYQSISSNENHVSDSHVPTFHLFKKIYVKVSYFPNIYDQSTE